MRMAELFFLAALSVACASVEGAAPDVFRGDDAAQSDTLGAPDDGLPAGLPFVYEREDMDAPLPAAEVDAFSREMRDFFQASGYLGWLLRMSHGVDASTGLRDFRLWWTDTHAVKQDGAVTIVHTWSAEHGGHNILKNNALVLATALAAAQQDADPAAAELAEQYCKGLSSTMLGMVHDEDDPLVHLMARNIVMANHRYVTHDGREKAVDYENWFFPYDRWNCSRFHYADNPWWGDVWVTNTRSKDGVGYLLWAWVPVLYASQRSPSPAVRAACDETRSLLAAFVEDIVAHGFHIRTKDAAGEAYTPGVDEGPPEADTGDLASFVIWDPLFPDAECNNKLASTLLARGEPGEIACTPLGGEPNYEVLSIRNNAPNGHIMRSFHIAAIQLALLRGYPEIAATSLAGLRERFERDRTLDLSQVSAHPARWARDLALNRLQAAGVGYPLSAPEVREIHTIFRRAAAEIADWPSWDLWDPSVPDGEHDWQPPSHAEDEEGDQVFWAESIALGLLYHYCWSPFRSPGGSAVVNCDILLGH